MESGSEDDEWSGESEYDDSDDSNVSENKKKSDEDEDEDEDDELTHKRRNKKNFNDDDDEEEEDSDNSEDHVHEIVPDADFVHATSSTSSKLLDPTFMIDAQAGQTQESQHSVFGKSRTDIFHTHGKTNKAARSRGRKSKRKSDKVVDTMIGDATNAWVDGDHERAIDICKQIITLNPKLVDPFNTMANIWFEKKNPEKEFTALEHVVELDPEFNISALKRLGELALILGRNDGKDGLACEDSLVGELLPPKKASDFVDASSELKKEYLRKGERFLLRIVKKNLSDTQIALLRGEMLERLWEYKKATDVYKRLLKQRMDAKAIDLLIVHRLARAYGLRKQTSKAKALLDKYVNAVLYPSPEDIGRIQASVQRSEQGRKKQLDERNKKREIRRKQMLLQNKKYSSDAGMGYEARLLDDSANVEGMDQLSESEDDEFDDEEEMHRVMVAAGKEQAEAGLNIFSMLLDYTVFDGQDYAHYVASIERFLSFCEHGLCSEPLLNQWQYWDDIKIAPTLDIVLLLCYCLIHLKKFPEARSHLKTVEHILDTQPEAFENKRIVLLYFKVADAWATVDIFVQGLSMFERLMTSKVLESLPLVIDAFSRAAFCCETIFFTRHPPKAVESASQKAVSYLKKTLEVLEGFSTFAKYQENKNHNAARLVNILRALNNESEADSVAKQYDLDNLESAEEAAVNLGKRARETQPFLMPPQPLFSSQGTRADINRQRKQQRTLGVRTVYASTLTDAQEHAVSAAHTLIEEGDYEAALKTILPAVRGYFEKDETFEEFFEECLGEAPSPTMAVNRAPSIETDSVFQVVNDTCICLMHLGKARLGAEFIRRVQNLRHGFRGVYKQKAALLGVTLWLHGFMIDTASKSLTDIARLHRDYAQQNDKTTWGGHLSDIWESLSAMVFAMTTFSSQGPAIKQVQRRLERLASGTNNREIGLEPSFGLTMLIAQHYILSSNPVRALSSYFQARNVCGNNPLVPLCIAANYMRLVLSKRATCSNALALKAFAHLEKYRELRFATSSETGLDTCVLEYEILYNYGRMMEQLGLTAFAMKYYERALEIESLPISKKRPAAYNLVQLFLQSGNENVAEALVDKYLSI